LEPDELRERAKNYRIIAAFLEGMADGIETVRRGVEKCQK